MTKHIAIVLLVVIMNPGRSDSAAIYRNNSLDVLAAFDERVVQLENSIREDKVGWDLVEILISRRTRKFQEDYLKFKTGFDPVLGGATQNVRERVTTLRTFGQVLAAIPELNSDVLTILDYQTRLNHIEFLILARQSDISSKLSIITAVVMGSLSVVISCVWAKKDSRKLTPLRHRLSSLSHKVYTMVAKSQLLHRRPPSPFKQRSQTETKKGKKKGVKGDLPLNGLLRNGQGIYATYKGKTYKAVVYSSGLIKFRGKKYSSPTGAAKAVVDRKTVNGWRFWKYRNKSGELVTLADLRA